MIRSLSDFKIIHIYIKCTLWANSCSHLSKRRFSKCFMVHSGEVSCVAVFFFFLKRRGYGNPTIRPYMFSLSFCCCFDCPPMNFYLLTETCSVWEWRSRVFAHFSERCTVWPQGEFAGMFTPGKICSGLKCIPLVTKVSPCKMVDSR